MHIRLSDLVPPFLSAAWWLATMAQAQCEPQHLTPGPFGKRFGWNVAMNDRHLLVGDRHDWSLCPTDPSCSNGMVSAFRKGADGNWAFDDLVTPADFGPGYSYGIVAVDGDRIIATATLSFGCGSAGVPHVFEFDGQRWVETATLCPPSPRAIHGDRLALHGDTALVGLAGVVCYRLGDSGWEVTHDLRNPDSPSVRSDFGHAMDLDDDWVVIGAPLERVVAPGGGAVYVYRRLPGNELELAQKLVAPDVFNEPWFGSSVALDGHTLAVGGDTATRTHRAQGVVYVHKLVDGRWELAQELVHEAPDVQDYFGSSIAVSGDLMVVGASGDRTGASYGGAYLFQRGGDGVWRQAAELRPTEFTVDYGKYVQLGGGKAAVAAPGFFVGDGNRGSVFVFDLACLLCPADLDDDGSLTVFDFLTFLNLFQDADPLADFDGVGELTIFDFLAFQTAFDAGCG